MLDERTVSEILAPVREYVTKELGVVANWRHTVDEDFDGIRGIIIRLDVFPNQGVTKEDYGKIDDAVWEAIRGNPLTDTYFPYVEFNALQQVPA